MSSPDVTAQIQKSLPPIPDVTRVTARPPSVSTPPVALQSDPQHTQPTAKQQEEKPRTSTTTTRVKPLSKMSSSPSIPLRAQIEINDSPLLPQPTLSTTPVNETSPPPSPAATVADTHTAAEPHTTPKTTSQREAAVVNPSRKLTRSNSHRLSMVLAPTLLSSLSVDSLLVTALDESRIAPSGSKIRLAPVPAPPPHSSQTPTPARHTLADMSDTLQPPSIAPESVDKSIALSSRSTSRDTLFDLVDILPEVSPPLARPSESIDKSITLLTHEEKPQTSSSEIVSSCLLML